MAYATVLFDLDGTLLDASGDLAAAVNRTREEGGHPPVALADVRAAIGDGARALVERTVPTDDLDATLARFREHYGRHLTEHTRLYPGIAQVLEALHAAGRTLAIVTNKPQAFTDVLVRHLDLERWFGAVVGGGTPAGLKPSPGPLEEALRRLGVGPEDTLMVGDGRQDVAAARALGIPVCGVLYGIGSPAEMRRLDPDHLVDDPIGIPEVVLRPG
jgi:phosphoglycolate phosphatase